MTEKDEKIEDTLGFDPSLKKKKKKKKVRIEGEEDDGVEAVTEAVAEVSVQEKPSEPAPAVAAEEISGELDLTKKKKKKKSVSDDNKVAEEKVTKTVATPAPTPAAAPNAEGSEDEADQDQDDDVGGPIEGEDDVVFDDGEGGSEVATKIGIVSAAKGPLPWANSDRDYTYEELLGRVMDTLREKNPDLSGEKKRFVMKPPHVVREGSKKTTFINFMEICKIMRRNHEHVYQFIMAELGTSGSIDGTNRMVIKGRFQPKAVENIIRRYVVEYVTCHSCKSPDTLLQKDNRLFFLLCNQCGAQRSVASIKTGFVAQVGKRKKA